MINLMNGLMTIQSAHSVKDTIERIIALMESKGLTTFARIDHAANAKNAGLSLRPTELVIFGNPKAGTILMQDNQTCGIDLPLKALAWKDENGNVHTLSASCTHKGCTVTWNNADRTWDCPCHGSMFTKDGNVIHGPAVKPLAAVTLPEVDR